VPIEAYDRDMTGPSDSERATRAEAMLDRIFTPAWRSHEGGVAYPSEAGQDFARLAVEHCYGDAWARGRLDAKTRSLLTLTVLASLGNESELRLHVQGALNLGHEPDDLVELFIHLMPYLGVPRVVQAMRVAGPVLREHAAKR
jgi:alkylhydroperoxidase/carboxymuconolactone decarboxylase family protein YurZ